MSENIISFWKSLDRTVRVSQRELVLGMTTCTLAGILLGIAFSPKKHITIGSYNGSDHITPAADPNPEDIEEE